MRHSSKMWDNAPNRPLRLKQRLSETGRTHAWLAEECTKKGYKISRVTMWGVINKQYRTPDYDRLKKVAEEVLVQNRISPQGVWNYLPGAEYKMGRMRPRYKPHPSPPRKRGGSPFSPRLPPVVSTVELGESKGGNHIMKGEELNYTKSYLDEEVLKHFGLESDPFFDVLDFQDIWLSPRLKVIERKIYDVVRRHGIMALVGPIGIGKTTFLRHVLTKLLKEKTVRLIIPDRMDRRQLNGAALTQAVITQLGGLKIPRSAIERDAMAKRLLEENVKMGFCPLLVLDESHDLQSEFFISLKRLWDSGMIFKLLSILLVGIGGSDEHGVSYGLLSDLQNNPWVREFSERCLVMEMGDIGGTLPQYLDFRFKKAGGDIHKIFSDKAIQVLSKRAETLQLVNNLGARAMQLAYKDGKFQIQPEHILQA